MLPRVVSRMAVGPDGSGPDGGGKGMIGCAGRIALDATGGACGGNGFPAGTMAMVSSTDFLRASERATAIATLNRQRHLTPSCGGFTPTAERTVGPARTIIGELDTQTRN